MVKQHISTVTHQSDNTQGGWHNIELLLDKIRVMNLNRNPEVIELIEQVSEWAESNQHPVYRIEAIHEKAIYLFWKKGTNEEAFKLAQQALDLVNPKEQPILAARIYKTMGMIFYYMGQYLKSQEYYLNALRLMESFPKKNDYMIEELARTYYGLAILHDLSQFDQLKKIYLGKALEHALQSGDKGTISRCYNAFAVYYAKRKEFEIALSYYQKSLDLAKTIGEKNMLAACYNNLGSTHVELKNFEKGLEYLNIALQLKKELGKPNAIGFTHIHIGKAYFDWGKYRESLENFLEAERLYLSVGTKHEMHTCYDYISKIYAILNDYELAYQYHKKFFEIYRENQGFDKAAAILDAQTKFELEKKEKEAELLRQKNAEIERYASRLESSNRELKQFAHIASHDLKEPLRMVGSYVSLLEKKLKGRLTEDESVYMQFILDGTKRMYALINDILEISKINVESNLRDVDLNMVVYEVIHNLAPEAKEKSDIVVKGTLPTIEADRTQMLQLFQNLISNAI
ncbi:MAG: tetratricopeptide repeat protein, partial [Chitinophagales bacterium]|nr:tetratricopeptide repeat protein [Chitinophagales bacterium]